MYLKLPLFAMIANSLQNEQKIPSNIWHYSDEHKSDIGLQYVTLFMFVFLNINKFRTSKFKIYKYSLFDRTTNLITAKCKVFFSTPNMQENHVQVPLLPNRYVSSEYHHLRN